MDHRWFMTVPGSRWSGGREGELELVPVGTVHAKEMGTIQTACGRACGPWTKFWERPFDPAAADVCSSCRAVVSQRGA